MQLDGSALIDQSSSHPDVCVRATARDTSDQEQVCALLQDQEAWRYLRDKKSVVSPGSKPSDDIRAMVKNQF